MSRYGTCAMLLFVTAIFVDAGRFLGTKQPVADLERLVLSKLSADLKRTDGRNRVDELEERLRPMYTALPKDSNGALGHKVVRYALHRYFMSQFSWFIRGLDPSSDSAGKGWQASFALDSVPVLPSLLQDSLERQHRGSGLSLRETAAIAAALEDLVHTEAMGKLNMSYEVLELSPERDNPLDSQYVNLAVATYMSIYLLGHNFSNWTMHEIRTKELKLFHTKRWQTLHAWLQRLQKNVTEQDSLLRDDGSVTYNGMTRIVEAVGDKFGKFNDAECHGMKHAMLEMEGKFPGRIRLSDFYNKSRHGVWGFFEHIDYLRLLGALDESHENNPQVIISNYLSSMPQCLRGSSIYSTCCQNECEALMATLESTIAAPEADPEVLLRAVPQLRSDTVKASWQLSEQLRSRLLEVARFNGGRVPLHGRLFAQWMHHVFPRECPYPHKAGTTSPYTPDEWMQETGRTEVAMSIEEMEDHIRPDESCSTDGVECAQELPWSFSEELMTCDLKLPVSNEGERSHPAAADIKEDPLWVPFVGFLAVASLCATLWSMKMRAASGEKVPHSWGSQPMVF